MSSQPTTGEITIPENIFKHNRTKMAAPDNAMVNKDHGDIFFIFSCIMIPSFRAGKPVPSPTGLFVGHHEVAHVVRKLLQEILDFFGFTFLGGLEQRPAHSGNFAESELGCLLINQ